MGGRGQGELEGRERGRGGGLRAWKGKGGKGKQEGGRERRKEGYAQIPPGGFVQAHGAGDGLDFLVHGLKRL